LQPDLVKLSRQIYCNFKKKEVNMIIVPIKEGENIDRALKKLKRKFEKTGILKELRERQKFTKPSVVKREQRIKAQYVQHLRDESEGM
jgi:small subunit ribosomal protein S21